MNKRYIKLRALVDKFSPFMDIKECETCDFACNITLNRSFLFSFEVDSYPKSMLKSFDGHYFINNSNNITKHALCRFLIVKDGKKRCSINETKPISCALIPISVHSIKSEPFWIFDGECPLSRKKAYLIKAKEFVNKFEKCLDKDDLKELADIAITIEKYCPFKELIPIKKFKTKS
jgi:Fe-S-cluster containining protein